MEGLASFAYFVDYNEFEISEMEDFDLYWILTVNLSLIS
jgi:hypothetical protein